MSDGPNGTRGFGVPDHNPIGHRDGRVFRRRPLRRSDVALQPAEPPSAHPAPLEDDEPVTYTLRGQFRALDHESEPMHTTHITLWECSSLDCAGLAVFGDRLEEHTTWHRRREQ